MEAEEASATAGTGKFMGRGGGGGESGHDFGADALIGEDFEEETVGDAAIDHVDLLDSGIESGEGGADLGDHAAGDDAFIDEPFDAGAVEGGDEGGWVGGVVHDAEDVGDVDEFGGAEAAAMSALTLRTWSVPSSLATGEMTGTSSRWMAARTSAGRNPWTEPTKPRSTG